MLHVQDFPLQKNQDELYVEEFSLNHLQCIAIHMKKITAINKTFRDGYTVARMTLSIKTGLLYSCMVITQFSVVMERIQVFSVTVNTRSAFRYEAFGLRRL